MSITVNLYYTGRDGSARKFAEEMVSSGTVDAIRAEPGNLKYDYFTPFDDPETVLLIDSWADQSAIDVHHASPMMQTIAALRSKYGLHMRVERYVSDERTLPICFLWLICPRMKLNTLSVVSIPDENRAASSSRLTVTVAFSFSCTIRCSLFSFHCRADSTETRWA